MSLHTTVHCALGGHLGWLFTFSQSLRVLKRPSLNLACATYPVPLRGAQHTHGGSASPGGFEFALL